MKIGAVQSSQLVTAISGNGATPQTSFKDVMKSVAKAGDLGGLQKDLNLFSQSVMAGKKFNPQDLIVYQMKAGQFGLGVELVSKVAESASATLRKLEQGH
jgi:hypothetical protein